MFDCVSMVENEREHRYNNEISLILVDISRDGGMTTNDNEGSNFVTALEGRETTKRKN